MHAVDTSRADNACALVTPDVKNTLLGDVRHWRSFLLEDPVDLGLRKDLPDFLKGIAHTFMGRADSSPLPGVRREMDHWYGTDEGQQTLQALLKRLWWQMGKASAHAMPAHDARHAMFKVPAAALEYLQSEQAEGWERLGLLSSLLHDHGRWAEERIWGGPQQSLVHARLSYLLGKELLEEFDLPQSISDQVLLATIAHSSGAGVQDPMPMKLTVAADRAQLLGAEIVIRLLHHPVLENGDLSTYASHPGTRSVLDRLFHFATTRLPGPLFSRDEAIEGLVDGLVDVLLLSEDEGASRLRFCGDRSEKQSLPLAEWGQRWTAARELPLKVGTAQMQAMKLLSVAHLAPGQHHLMNALKKLPVSDTAASRNAARALAHAEHLRAREDARQVARLHVIREQYDDDSLVRELASLLIAQWDGPALRE